MTKKANGKFTVFDGYCHGYNIELVEGKKIEQAWYFNEPGWPEDHYSICEFLLELSSKGTKLKFTQSGVPLSALDSLAEGWYIYYWNPIEQFIQNNKS